METLLAHSTYNQDSCKAKCILCKASVNVVISAGNIACSRRVAIYGLITMDSGTKKRFVATLSL